MAIDPGKFRADFPEFTDATIYPDSAVNYWINLAGLLLNPARWSDKAGASGTLRSIRDVGTELFVAHNLVLEKLAQDSAGVGGDPGTETGVIAAKAVDKVSVNYDVAAGIDPTAGHWNLTTFGTRFWKLLRMMGAGPVQLGIGRGPVGGAWSGPWAFNFPNPSD